MGPRVGIDKIMENETRWNIYRCMYMRGLNVLNHAIADKVWWPGCI